MKTQDIFTGGNISVALGSDLTNTNLNGLGFVEIPSVNSFPEISASRNAIKVVDYSSPTDRTLIGRRSFGETSLSINYIPGDPVHERLLAIAEGTNRIQIRVTYCMDEDRDYGPSYLLNGYLSGDALGGDTEATVTQTFTFAIDKLVARGILDLTSQGGGTLNPLIITTDLPATKSIKHGDAAEFEVVADGGYPPYTYRWYKDGQLTQVNSSNTHDLSAEPVGSSVQKVVVVDSMGQTTSSIECTLTVTA